MQFKAQPRQFRHVLRSNHKPAPALQSVRAGRYARFQRKGVGIRTLRRVRAQRAFQRKRLSAVGGHKRIHLMLVFHYDFRIADAYVDLASIARQAFLRGGGAPIRTYLQQPRVRLALADGQLYSPARQRSVRHA